VSPRRRTTRPTSCRRPRHRPRRSGPSAAWTHRPSAQCVPLPLFHPPPLLSPLTRPPLLPAVRQSRPLVQGPAQQRGAAQEEGERARAPRRRRPAHLRRPAAAATSGRGTRRRDGRTVGGDGRAREGAVRLCGGERGGPVGARGGRAGCRRARCVFFSLSPPSAAVRLSLSDKNTSMLLVERGDRNNPAERRSSLTLLPRPQLTPTGRGAGAQTALSGSCRPPMSRTFDVALCLSAIQPVVVSPPLRARSPRRKRLVPLVSRPHHLTTMPGDLYSITSTVALPNDPESRSYPRFGLGASPFEPAPHPHRLQLTTTPLSLARRRLRDRARRRDVQCRDLGSRGASLPPPLSLWNQS